MGVNRQPRPCNVIIGNDAGPDFFNPTSSSHGLENVREGGNLFADKLQPNHGPCPTIGSPMAGRLNVHGHSL